MTVTESERMLNTGTIAHTKKLGDVRVKEISLEAIVRLSEPIIELIKSLNFAALEGQGDEKLKGFEFFQSVMTNPRLLPAMKLVMAEATERKATDFDNLSPVDWLRLFVKFKEVTDWEEMTELFTNLLPVAKLRAGKASVTNVIANFDQK
jgi:hypothetical protein